MGWCFFKLFPTTLKSKSCSLESSIPVPLDFQFENWFPSYWQSTAFLRPNSATSSLAWSYSNSYWEPAVVPKQCLNVCYRKNLGKWFHEIPFPVFRMFCEVWCFRYVSGVQIPPQEVFESLGIDLHICFQQGRVFESTSRFVCFEGLSGWLFPL